MENVVSTQWRILAQPPPGDVVPRGLDALWHQIGGRAGRIRCRPRHFLQAAERILAREKDFDHLPDRRLRRQMTGLRPRFQLRRDTPADRERAFAILREVTARAVGLRPYREQVAAALALEAGCVAEMATGEGKTLVATLPAVLAGWRGRGCHVITANDYLAARDADLMQAVYRFCGLSVGCITQEMPADKRQQAYSAHVTYGTNKEVAADYLRDRLLKGGLSGLSSVLLAKIAGRGDHIDRLVQRGLECAIVDEADSVFIDEAATPLLISGQGANPEQIEAYEQAAQLVGGLDPSQDYRVDPQAREVRLTAAGQARLAALAEPLGGLWKGRRRREELIRQSLAAHKFFLRGKHYIVDDGQVVIVDEFTGRVMPERTWRDGLHQAVEAKEGLTINLPKETHARISFQRFFRMYRKLSGMSGTVAEAQSELWGIYHLPVIAIPTHRPCQRVVMPDRVFTTAEAKWAAVVEAIDTVHRSGRPILIGTGSIRESEYLSALLTARQLPHRLLNATRQVSEATIIAAAGRKAQITVATNMAGRGTDIKLSAAVAQRGGLHVIATQRFEARRIDRQLFGRCARQGDPGSAQVFISLEDELIQKHQRRLAKALGRWVGRTPRPEISSPRWRRKIEALQRRAERVSSRMRQDVLFADNWLDDHLGFAANEL
jgi:preprotein translocase subunit SecA